ncbi:MAG: Asp-tRNA(Asn)/Glu-tRNA(Gln) amidotransferase subunit GatC [Bacteroidetes bacterium]|nr:MAG: Asp-tRNA(Asn)/Glu-tRNA(Gln) amidotransferase subunit GatC [Bacteroidota bacterium]
MNVDHDTIAKLAHLSRLTFNDQDEEKMIRSLNEILSWVEQLEEIDTTNVEPLRHMTEEMNAFRKDEVLEPLAHEKGLINAPKRDSDYFRVPKVLE